MKFDVYGIIVLFLGVIRFQIKEDERLKRLYHEDFWGEPGDMELKRSPVQREFAALMALKSVKAGVPSELKRGGWFLVIFAWFSRKDGEAAAMGYGGQITSIFARRL